MTSSPAVPASVQRAPEWDEQRMTDEVLPFQGFVYLLRCVDHSLYIGSTNDIVRRLGEHQRGQGARYTRGRLPVELVLLVSTATLSCARRQEAWWKQLSRPARLALVASFE
jgi:putative endonuclease